MKTEGNDTKRPVTIGWLAQVSGNIETLKELSQQPNQELYRLIEGADGFYLILHKMPYVSDYIEVREKAKNIIATLNHLLAWLAPGRADLVLGSIDRIRPDGKKEIFLESTFHVSVNFTASSLTIGADGSIVEPPSLYTNIFQFAALASDQEALNDVLRLWNRPEQDWTNLYRIFEIIEQATEGKPHKFGSSKSQFTLFKWTANSRAAIGDHARHGVDDREPPKKPMTFENAQALIKQLTDRWITSLTLPH